MVKNVISVAFILNDDDTDGVNCEWMSIIVTTSTTLWHFYFLWLFTFS